MRYKRAVCIVVLLLIIIQFAWLSTGQEAYARQQEDVSMHQGGESLRQGDDSPHHEDDSPGHGDNSLQTSDSRQESAWERSIYIGDLITIEVVSDTFSREELEEKFSEFEVVDIKSTTKGYLVTIRSFVPGEKTVTIGNKEIVIKINSTLEDFQREDVFEGDTSPEDAGFAMNWRILFFMLIAVFTASGGVLLRQFLLKRRTARLSPYKRFIERCRVVPLNDRYFFVKLTMYFKEYIESVYNISIKGKTTNEIMDGVSLVAGLQKISPLIRNWLNESDYYKFSGVAVSREKKRLLLDGLVEIVDRIESKNEEEMDSTEEIDSAEERDSEDE